MISHGDIKSVQADAGHSTARMVTDQYAEIQTEHRKALTGKMEIRSLESNTETVGPDGFGDVVEILKQKPELINLIKALKN